MEFAASMEECLAEGLVRLKTPEDRLLVARKLLCLKKRKEQREYASLKLLMPPDQPNKLFDNPCFITIVRDPRDVVASHVNLKWDNKISDMANTNER
ncbi:MAG: sulfotransferase domain-containing protein [Shimia sp.]|nr:sulfotransferase domain-containing protein [Shimia sp.]